LAYRKGKQCHAGNHRQKTHYPWLTPPQNRGELTVRDVLQARNSAEHHVAVQDWAWSVWQAWHEYHATIFIWIDRLES
jgi:hypothetical protein